MGWTRRHDSRAGAPLVTVDTDHGDLVADAFELLPVTCSVLDVTTRRLLVANALCRDEIGAPETPQAQASAHRLSDLLERHGSQPLVDHVLARSNGTVTAVTAVPLSTQDGHRVVLLVSRDITAERAGQANARLVADRLAEVQNVNEAIRSADSTTRELSASIQLIASNAADASHTATTAVRTANEACSAIQRLDEFSTAIAAIVGVIDSIAGQTNLLALNATIEAARAGEAGRSFSVVASEVKDLARATNTATEKIRNMVASIQTETATTMAAIIATTSVIQQIQELQTTIASAVEEQHAATAGISEHISHAAHQTDTIATFLREHAP